MASSRRSRAGGTPEMYEPSAAKHAGNGFKDEETRPDDAPSISLNRSRARDRFQRAARSATAMLHATEPARRKGLLADRKEAELEALVEQKLERGDLAPLVRPHCCSCIPRCTGAAMQAASQSVSIQYWWHPTACLAFLSVCCSRSRIALTIP